MTFARRVLWGARWGALFGLALSGLAVFAFLIGGLETFDGLNTTLPRVVAVYLGGGTLAGILVGILLRVTTRPAGAAAVGFLCGLLITALIRVARHGLTDWTRRDAFVMLLTSAALGIPVGMIYRDIFAPSEKATGRR